MQNQNYQFKELIEKAYAVLGSPYLTVKEQYISYPLCLIEHIENEIHRYVIEISLKDYQAKLSCEFDLDNYCNELHLSFDTSEEDNLFIEYLIENEKYNFKHSHWIIGDCLLNINSPFIETVFIFRK